MDPSTVVHRQCSVQHRDIRMCEYSDQQVNRGLSGTALLSGAIAVRP
jgi:hypothetical protein